MTAAEQATLVAFELEGLQVSACRVMQEHGCPWVATVVVPGMRYYPEALIAEGATEAEAVLRAKLKYVCWRASQ